MRRVPKVMRELIDYKKRSRTQRRRLMSERSGINGFDATTSQTLATRRIYRHI